MQVCQGAVERLVLFNGGFLGDSRNPRIPETIDDKTEMAEFWDGLTGTHQPEEINPAGIKRPKHLLGSFGNS